MSRLSDVVIGMLVISSAIHHLSGVIDKSTEMLVMAMFLYIISKREKGSKSE